MKALDCSVVRLERLDGLIIIIIMYIYDALINARSARQIHINLNLNWRLRISVRHLLGTSRFHCLTVV